ncbi:CAMK/CAMKL protein kinase [Plasmodium inui San Antonio 1]|uniref:CAMK/CAMKL protein kinase n=1 Tax=Plasmodium inui San Antonio 1 TaxID=1237626 RepID=W7AL74_9APIC|nr:CAMK/CAMKL protein kinase [Plasmodium inui San Antonio 1]EUD69514.1 CAMK/CAMKL protein kinase [Plasmodium inui San Antonio 1]
MALTDKWRTEWDRELRLLPQVESIADHDLQITEDIFFIWQFLKMYHTSMPHVRNLIDFITIKKPESLIWGEHIDDYMFRGMDKGQRLFNLLVSDGKRIHPRYSKKKLCDTLLYFRIKNYIILEKINTGSVGQVHLALDKNTDTLVAAKAIDKSTVQGDEELFQKLKEEISISCRMNHPFVVKTTNVLETRDKIIQIMEYCDGGDLISYVRNKLHLEEISAHYFFRKIVQGLQYMHRNNVSHRDLKPENIFLCKRQLSQREKTLIRIGKLPSCSEYELKIGDFGASCVNEKNKLHHDIVGTLSYAAPEVLGCNTTCGYSSQKADVWSLGIILYAMLFGLLPFDNEGKNVKEAYNSIIKNKIVFPKHRVNKISMNARNLLSGMLTINPTNRLSLDEVLNHEWLADTGKTKLEVSQVHKKMNFPISSTVACPVGSGKNDMDFETFKKLFLIKRENGPAATNLSVHGVVPSAIPRGAQNMVHSGMQNMISNGAQNILPSGAPNGLLINMLPSVVQNVVSGMVPHGIPCAIPFGAPYATPYASASPKENDNSGTSPRSDNEKGQVCHLQRSNSLMARSDPYHVRQNQNQNINKNKKQNINQNKNQNINQNKNQNLNQNKNQNLNQNQNTNPSQFYLYHEKGVLNTQVNPPNGGQHNTENPVYADALLAQKKEQGETSSKYALNEKREEGETPLMETDKKYTHGVKEDDDNDDDLHDHGNDRVKVGTQKGITNHRKHDQNNYYVQKTYFKNAILDNTYVEVKNNNQRSSVNYYETKQLQLEHLEENKLKLMDQANKNPPLCAKKNGTYDFYFNKNNMYRNQSNNIFLLPCRENLIGKNNRYSNLYLFKRANHFNVTSSAKSPLLSHYDQCKVTTSREYDTSWKFKYAPNASDGRESTITSNCTNVTPSPNNTPSIAKVNVSPRDAVFYENPNYNHHVQYKYYYYDDKGTYVGCLSNQTSGRTCASSCVLLENQVNCAANNADYTKEWTYRRGVSEYVQTGTSTNNSNCNSNNNNACSSDRKREDPFVKHREGEGHTKLHSYEWGKDVAGALLAASENRANVMTSGHGHPRVVQQVGRAPQVGSEMGEHARCGITDSSNPTRDTLLTDGTITSKVSTPTNNDTEVQLRRKNHDAGVQLHPKNNNAEGQLCPKNHDRELQLRPTNSKKKDTCIILTKEGILPNGNKHSFLMKSQHATKIVSLGESTCDQMDMERLQINQLKGNPKGSQQKQNKSTLNLFIQKGRINGCEKMDRAQEKEKNISPRAYTDEHSDKWNMQSEEKDERAEFLPSGDSPGQTYTSNSQNTKMNNNADEEVHDAIHPAERKTEKDNNRETHKGDNNAPGKIVSLLPVKDENKNVTSQEGSNTPGEKDAQGNCKPSLEQSYSDGSETKTKKKKKKKIISINNPSKEIQRRQSKSDPSSDDKQENQVDKKKNITNRSSNNNRSGIAGQSGQKHACGEKDTNSSTRGNHDSTDTAVVGARKSSWKNEGEKNKVDKRRGMVIENAIEKPHMPNLSKPDRHGKEKTNAPESRRYTSTDKTTYGHLEVDKKLCKNKDKMKQRDNKIFNEEQINRKNKFFLLKKLYYSNHRDLHVLPNSENQHERKHYINFQKIFLHRKRKTDRTHIPPLSYYKKSNLCFSKRVKKDRKQRGEESKKVVKNQMDVCHRAYNPQSKNDVINIRHFSEWYYANGCSQHELTTKEKWQSKERVPIYDNVSPYDEQQVSDKEYVYFSSNKIEYIKCATRRSISQDSHNTYSAHYYYRTMSETNGGVSNQVSEAPVVSADKSSAKCSEKTDTILCAKKESQNYISKRECGINNPTCGFKMSVKKCSLSHEAILFNRNGNVMFRKNNLANQMGPPHLSSNCPSQVKPTLSLSSYYNEKGVNDMGKMGFTRKDTEKPNEWGNRPIQPGHNLNVIIDRHCEKSGTYTKGDIESGGCIPNLKNHVFHHSPIDQSIKVHQTQDNEATHTESSPFSAENNEEGYSPEEVGSANVTTSNVGTSSDSTSNDNNRCRRNNQGITTELQELRGVLTSDATNNSYIVDDATKRKDYTSLYDDVKKSYLIIQNVSYKDELTKEKMKNKNGERIITRSDAKEQIQENEENEEGGQLRVKRTSRTEHSTPQQGSDKNEPTKSTTMKISKDDSRPTNRRKGRSGEDEQDKSSKGAGKKFPPLKRKKGPVWKNSPSNHSEGNHSESNHPPSNPQNNYVVEFPRELNRDLSEGRQDEDKSQPLGSRANRKDTHLLVMDDGKNPHLDTQHIYMMNANLKNQKPQGEKEKHERNQKGSVHNGPIKREHPSHELTSSKTNEKLTKNKKETTLKERKTDRSKQLANWNIWNEEKNDTIHSKEKHEDYLTHNRSYDLKNARSNLLSMSYDENVRNDYTDGNLLVNPEHIASINDFKSIENDETNKMMYYYNLDSTPANLDFLNNLMFYSSHINPYRHYKNSYLSKKSSLTQGGNLTNSKQSSGNNRTEQRSDHQNVPTSVDHNLRNYLNLNKTSIQNFAKTKRNYIREQNYEYKFGTKMDDQIGAISLYPKLRWMNIFSRNSSKY